MVSHGPVRQHVAFMFSTKWISVQNALLLLRQRKLCSFILLGTFLAVDVVLPHPGCFYRRFLFYSPDSATYFANKRIYWATAIFESQSAHWAILCYVSSVDSLCFFRVAWRNSSTSGYCSCFVFLLRCGSACCFANGCLIWPARFGVIKFGQQGLGKTMIGDFCYCYILLRTLLGPFSGPSPRIS